MATVHVTVEGVPLEEVIAEEVAEEYRTHQMKEIKNMAVLVAMSRSNATAKLRNHSGARTGRGRVIYTAGGAA